MSETKTGSVTNPKLIQEITEAVEQYNLICEETIQGEKKIRHARKGMVKHIFTLPDEGDDIKNWKEDVSENFACQLDLVASAHIAQGQQIQKQVHAMRRMNRAIIVIREDAFDGEG